MNILELNDDILYLINKNLKFMNNKKILINSIKENIKLKEQCSCFNKVSSYGVNKYYCLSNVEGNCHFIKQENMLM